MAGKSANSETVTLTLGRVIGYFWETPPNKSIPRGFEPPTLPEVPEDGHFHFR
jgi:hypothetical protein